MQRSAEASTTHVHMGVKSSNNDQSTLPCDAHHDGHHFFSKGDRRESKTANATCQEATIVLPIINRANA